MIIKKSLKLFQVTIIDDLTSPMEEVLGAAVGVLVASTNDGKDFVSF